MSKRGKEKRKREREKRKNRTVKDMIKDYAGLLTDEEVFTSSEIKKYISYKIKSVVTEYGRKAIRLKIYWNASDTSTIAYTNNQEIIVNAAHPIFIDHATREEKHSRILGVCAHEVSHYLFTNFTAGNEWIKMFDKGKLYPSTPQFDGSEMESKAVLLDNLKRFEEFLDGKTGCTKSPDPVFTNREWITRAAHFIWNICEDGRIENIFSNYCSNHRMMYYGLLDLVKAQRDVCPTLPELLEKINSKEVYEYEVLTSIMLHYMRFGEIKGYVHKSHKDEPVVVAFSKIVPLLDEYLEAMDSYTCLTCLNKIIITIWPEIEKFIEDINEKLDLEGCDQSAGPGIMTQRSVMIPGQTGNPGGDSEGTDGFAFNNAKPGANPSPTPKPSYQEKSENTSSSCSSGMTEEGTASEEGNGSGSGKKDEESGSEEKIGAGAGNEKNDNTSDSETGSSGSEDKGNVGSEASSTGIGPDGNSESALHSPGSNDSESLYKRTSGIAGDLDGGGESAFEIQEKANTEFDLREVLEELVKSRNDELSIREMQNDLESLDDDIDYGKAHEGVSCSFIRHKVTEENRVDYLYQSDEVNRLVNEMLKKSTILETDDAPMEYKNKYCGRRFNASATAKGDYRYFSRSAAIEPNYALDVIILCDQSGSMAGERMRACKATAVCCYEFMNRACGEGHVSVIGHNTRHFFNSHDEGHVKIYCYADFDSPDKDDLYRLMNMNSGGSNRDGYALRFAKEKIAERDAERKLIIVISDGQPADRGYCGTEAMADIRSVLRECDRDGIMYIAAAIGSDQEEIKTIYGEKHFLDISSLNELPTKLMSLISKLIK